MIGVTGILGVDVAVVVVAARKSLVLITGAATTGVATTGVATTGATTGAATTATDESLAAGVV